MSKLYFPNWNISHSLEGGGVGATPPAPVGATIIPPPLTEELRLEELELDPTPPLEMLPPLTPPLLPPPPELLLLLLLLRAPATLEPPKDDDRSLPPLSIQEEWAMEF